MSLYDGGMRRRGISGLLAILLLGLAGGCGGEDEAGDTGRDETSASDPESWEGDPVAATRALRSPEGTEEDWEIFRSKVTWAWEAGLDTLPIGEAMAEIGLSFVGDPYIPGTLELAGPEGVVVNFEGFDCVTLVENAFALARFIKSYGPEVLESEGQSRELYRGALREMRYRNARVAGYPSRLHYFSDWILDNEAKGLVQEITGELGGEMDYKAIDFMTTHPDAYRQMSDAATWRAIQETEDRLSGMGRPKLPEEEIPTWMSWIRNGDIIAATTTVDGLDVAHTGLALWQDSELHLLHAPLVGEVVEVSQRPLAERILRLEGQDGIRVVRPLDLPGSGGGAPAR
jgi:hypothetical protein